MEAIDAILKAREEIDRAIQGHLDAAAGLRKKREALTNTLDILRASERDIEEAPAPRGPSTGIAGIPTTRPKVFAFNEAEAEEAVIRLLDCGMLSFAQIDESLWRMNVTHSKAGLHRILKTSPCIQMIGERERTRYALVAKQEVA